MSFNHLQQEVNSVLLIHTCVRLFLDLIRFSLDSATFSYFQTRCVIFIVLTCLLQLSRIWVVRVILLVESSPSCDRSLT